MTDPDPIEPDTKNWTWVLERACPECGFEASHVDVAATAAEIRRLAAAWSALLEADPAAEVRRRTRPDRWSILEYGCHVRDVFTIFDGRLARITAEVDPLFDNWDQDRTAVDDRYAAQDPAVVAAQVTAAGAALAARYEQLDASAWARTGRRSDGASFTIDSFTRYLLHDPIHHLWDVDA